jgi:hypothetical protein
MTDNDAYETARYAFEKEEGEFCVLSYDKNGGPYLEKHPTDDFSDAKRAANRVARDGTHRAWALVYRRDGDNVWALTPSQKDGTYKL